LLWTWDCYGGDTQQWAFQDGQLVYLPDPSKCVDLLGGDSTNGNKLGIWDCYQGDSQLWGFDAELGTIYLASSTALDATKCAQIGGERVGDPLVIWDCAIEPNQQPGQIWKLGALQPSPAPAPEPTPPPASQQGVKNKKGVCLQTEQSAMGQSVTVAECNGSDEQEWDFSCPNGWATITHQDLCLEVLDATMNGSPVILNSCQQTTRQHFRCSMSKSGFQWLTFSVGAPEDQKQCLDVWTDNATNTTGLWTWECNDLDNQAWQHIDEHLHHLQQTAWVTV
jgi:hypothetical protein